MRERPRRRDAVDVAVPRRYQSTQAKDKKDKKDKGDKKDKKSKKVLTQCHERDAVFMQTSTRRRAASTPSNSFGSSDVTGLHCYCGTNTAEGLKPQSLAEKKVKPSSYSTLRAARTTAARAN